MFSVRIVTTDHYTAAPLRGLDVCYSDFRQCAVKKVPVFRLFGSTPSGQKTCMHIHGVFPYLYVPYDGSQPWDRYLHQFAASLDKAINIAFGNEHSKVQHVYKVALVSGIPMYGFHDKEEQFLKIYLYNPNLIRRVADLLLGGAVMNKVFQPHESHIQYPLQLFIDYNLYGMNMIHVAAVKFRQWTADGNDNDSVVEEKELRRNLSDPASMASHDNSLLGSSTPPKKTWTQENIPSDMLLGNDVTRLSTCELEVDVVAADILNRLEVNDNLGTNPGLAALWEDERQRKRDRGESSQITPPQSPVRADIHVAESHLRLKERLEEILQEQLPYMDSQTSKESVCEDVDEEEATMASVVEDHLSQLPDSETSSQDTVICDDDGEGNAEQHGQVPAIVNRDSISQVLLSSQSFIHVSPEEGTTVRPDDSLVEILAALAESGSPVASQSAAAQVTALEERDSVLSGVSLPPVAEGNIDELEEAEMSQRIWDTDPAQDQDQNTLEMDMNDSWTESQFLEDAEKIPQLDGPMDEKPAGEEAIRKRLGTRGPVVTQVQQPSTDPQGNPLVSHERLQYPAYHNVPPNQLTSIHPPHSYNPVWNPRHQYQQQCHGPNKGGKDDGRNQWYMSQHGPEPQGYGSHWGNNPIVNQQHKQGSHSMNQQQQPYHLGQSHCADYRQMSHVAQCRPAHSYPRDTLKYNPMYYQNNGAMNSTPPDSMNRGHIPTSPPLISSSSPVSSSGHGHSTTCSINNSQSSPLSIQMPFHSQQRYADMHSPPVDPSLHSSMSHHHLSPCSPQLAPGHFQAAWPDRGYTDSRSPAQSPVSSQGFDPHHVPLHQRNVKPSLNKPHSIIAGLLSGQGSPHDKVSRYERSASHSALNISTDSQDDLFADASSLKSRPRSTSSHSSLSSRSSICSDHTVEHAMAHVSQPFSEGQACWQTQMPHRQAPYAGSGALSSLEDFVQNVNCDTGMIYDQTISPVYEDQHSWPVPFPSQSNLSQSPVKPVMPVRQVSAPNYVNSYEKWSNTQQSYNRNTYPSDSDKKSPSVTSCVTSLPSSCPTNVRPGNKPSQASSRGKAGRMRKLGLTLLKRNNSLPADASVRQQSSYSYAFHVPTPVYKRMKMLQRKCDDQSLPKVSIVRMHPMDARKYSLLKIGRELVKTKLLSEADISNIKVDLMAKTVTAVPNLTETTCNMMIPSNPDEPSQGEDLEHLATEEEIQPVAQGKPTVYTQVKCKKKRKLDRKLKPVIRSQKPKIVKIKPHISVRKSFKRKSETELLLEITGPDGSTCASRGVRKKMETTPGMDIDLTDVKGVCNTDKSVGEDSTSTCTCMIPQQPASSPTCMPSSQPVDCLNHCEGKTDTFTDNAEVRSGQELAVAERDVLPASMKGSIILGTSVGNISEKMGGSEKNSTKQISAVDNTEINKGVCGVTDDTSRVTTGLQPLPNNLPNLTCTSLNQSYCETSVSNTVTERVPKKLTNDEKYPPMSVYGGNLPPSMAMYASVEPISSEEEDNGNEMPSIPKNYTQSYNPCSMVNSLSMFHTSHTHKELVNVNLSNKKPDQSYCSKDPHLNLVKTPSFGQDTDRLWRDNGNPSDPCVTKSANPASAEDLCSYESPVHQTAQPGLSKPVDTTENVGKDLSDLDQSATEEKSAAENSSEAKNGSDSISSDSAAMPVLQPITATEPRTAHLKNVRRLSLKKRRRSKSYCDDLDDVYMVGGVKQQTLQWTERRSKRSSANYGQNAFSHLLESENIDDTGSEDDFKTARAPRRRCTRRKDVAKDNLQEGVHYIVVGKFKGYKRMVVVVGNDEIHSSSVSVEQFLQATQHCEFCQAARSKKAQCYKLQCEKTDDSSKDSVIEGQTSGSSQDCIDPGLDLRLSLSASSSDSNVDNDPESKDDDSCDTGYGKNSQRSVCRKRTLTRNQRLGVAFLTKKAKRKRSATPTSSGSVMTSLSLLHQATLANLTDVAAYTDKCNDDKVQYDDVMHKMALVSPPSSDKGENSPPQPISPSTGSGSKEPSGERKEDVSSKPDRLETVISASPQLTKKCDDSQDRIPQTNVENMGMSETPTPTCKPSESADSCFSNQTMPNLREENMLRTAVTDTSKPASEQLPTPVHKKDHPLLLKNIKLKIPPKYLRSNVQSQETNKQIFSPPDLGPPNIPRYNTTLTTKLPDIQPPSLYCNRASLPGESDTFNNETQDPLDTTQNPATKTPENTSEEILAENSKLKREGFVKMLDFSRDIACRFPQEVETQHSPKLHNTNKDDVSENQSAQIPEHYPIENGTYRKRNNNTKTTAIKKLPLRSNDDRCATSQHEHRTAQVIKRPVQYLETGLSAKDLYKLPHVYNEHSSLGSFKTSTDEVRETASQQGFGQQTRENHSNSGELSQSMMRNSQLFENNAQPWERSIPDNRNLMVSPSWKSSTWTGQGKTVVTPLLPPPSLHTVRATAGLCHLDARDPFCSNPADIPERTREIAGRVLKLNSNMPADLEEFHSELSTDGLKAWRRILAEDHALFSQQTVNSSFIHRLETDEQLKYAVIGDKCRVISPCLSPPSSRTVQKWWKQKMDNEVKKTENKVVAVTMESVVDSSVNLNRLKQGCNSESSKLPVIKVCDKVLTVPEAPESMKGSYLEDRDGDLPPGTCRSPAKPSTLTDVSPAKTLLAVSQEVKPTAQIQSPQINKLLEIHEGKEDMEEGSFTPKCQDSDILSPKQSTPVKWTSVNKPIKLPCTPINAPLNTDGNPSLGGPKHCPPKRQVSNKSQNLRRSLLASQVQNLSVPSTSKADVSQIDGPTPKNTFGFRFSQNNAPDSKALHEIQYLTVLSLEVHAETRGDRKPDPDVDPILAIFYSIRNDIPPDEGQREITGAILVDEASSSHALASGSLMSDSARKTTSPLPQTSTLKHTPHSPQPSTSIGQPDTPQPSTSKLTPPDESSGSDVKDGTTKSSSSGLDLLLHRSGVSGLEISYVQDEMNLIHAFLRLIRRWDPDILVGYEIQMLSLGYLLKRASHLGIDLCAGMSRIPDSKNDSHNSAEKDEFGADYMSEIHISGRIVLNLWRIMKHEVALNQYSFENVAFHVLHRRMPNYSHRSLTNWFNHRTHLHRWRVVDYYVNRVKGNHEIIEQLNLIGRTSEFARVFGIEFFNVLSRGSQYRVESMMLRLAKPLNFIPLSPSVHQRARMKAPECIPLTLEPESRFYTHPVVVVDFQSLYPSIMIAYNYCFSTCLGRVENLAKSHDGAFEFGCTSLSVNPSQMRKLKEDVTISPNGVVFVKEHVRKGIISSMVEEILNTRIMVKKEMKSYKSDKGLSRLLHARQLGLKLIANVTYGYTAANFSGRMPCVELGDSIVRKARETLEKAITIVEENQEWRARVVYGDTDSMFIELEGRSKDEAFQIGQEIADAVTAINPKPIKLKFEKVYYPCVLQTKKRYFGYMYETPDQKEAVFDAKGIETVRRDNCPAVSKILEKCIKILFTTRDVSLIKQYVLKQCVKLLQGRVSIQDCIFAKEYRGMPGYKPGACVPALEIAKKRIRHDRRSEPRVGERVPYVIVYGSPGLPLIQLVREPMELLQDSSLMLNTTYYITKQILPPLDRFLGLLGVNVFTWYQEMPRIVKVNPAISATGENKKGTISQYFSVTNCPVCDEQTKQPVCLKCQSDPQTVVITLNERIRHWEKTHQHLSQVCTSCMGVKESNMSCVSLDCPILYRLNRANQDRNRCQQLRQVVEEIF